MTKLVHGFGLNDMKGKCKDGNKQAKFYTAWKHVITRCYSPTFHKDNPTYVGCTVCEEWLILSNFKKWYDKNYIEGYQLDKDILVEGNKVYSPETCVYVTPQLNSLFLSCSRVRGVYPQGVSKIKSNGKYVASMNRFGRLTRLGTYDTIESASEAYKKAKHEYILEVCERHRGIDLDVVLDAILNIVEKEIEK